MTFIQFADVICGTGRLSTLYVALEFMKFPAAFCRFAVYICTGEVALTRQSIAQLHGRQAYVRGLLPCCIEYAGAISMVHKAMRLIQIL